MSVLVQKRRSGRAPITSGLPRQADVFGVGRRVSNVPQADPRFLIWVMGGKLNLR
jgi:hypothetical protein